MKQWMLVAVGVFIAIVLIIVLMIVFGVDVPSGGLE